MRWAGLPVIGVAFVWLAAVPARSALPDAAGLVLKDQDTIVFLGDELTETPDPSSTNSYPLLVESFLAVRYPDLRLHFVNAGWAEDTAERARLRLERDVLVHHPKIIVVCLGFNDPEYLPLVEEKVAAFRREVTELVQQCRPSGARVWLMSPPSVDEDRGRRVRIHRKGRPGVTDLKSIQYNAVLARYAAVVAQIADETKSGFVDWYRELEMAREEAQRHNAGFSFSSNGLVPNSRGHALAAAALLKAWGVDPIQVLVELNWEAGAVEVKSNQNGTPSARVERSELGQRILSLQGLPLPWPMAGGKAGPLAPDWEAASMCRILLRVTDPHGGDVNVGLPRPGGPKLPLNDADLRAGFNLAATELARSSSRAEELFQLIATKNYYRYGTWRKLELQPPPQPELVEAHRQLIVAWNSYVSGTEEIIQKLPKTFDLTLVLAEAVPPEVLPTSQPVARVPTVPRSAPAESPASQPTSQPSATQPAESQPAPSLPVTTQPLVAELPKPAPPESQPAATAPADSQPPASQPATTEPSAPTEPAVSTEPAEPAATQPSPSSPPEPPASEPAPKEPPASAPSPGEQPVSAPAPAETPPPATEPASSPETQPSTTPATQPSTQGA